VVTDRSSVVTVRLDGRRVSIRPVAKEDLSGIHAWYEEAATAAYDPLALEERCRREESLGELMAIVRPDSDEPIGLTEYHAGEPEDRWLTVTFIALAKAYRGWGYGSEAVRLLEEWAAREGLADGFRAEVDVRNGLGLYFWLRLGYRPGATEEGRGGLGMVRDAG
jgi:RimJ/RimL family protein N-acetyltransferase